MTKKRDRPDFTPLEELVLAVSHLVVMADAVIDATNNGRPHECGSYIKKEAAVISAHSQEKIELVGVRIPMDLALRIRDRYHVARVTDFCKQLDIKVNAALEAMHKESVEGNDTVN
jgi:hypothetical protein